MRKCFTLHSILTFCLISVLGFTSCNDDKYSIDQYWVSLTTVNKIGNNTYDFTLDNGQRLWIAAPAGLSIKPKYDRAIINYTLLSDQFEGYDHTIRLNAIYDVLTKDVIYIAPDNKAEQDSIGHDPISVRSMWEGGGYLNISFGYNTSGTISHMLNLVSDESDKAVNKETVKLAFRHNKMADPELYPANGYISFSLAPYRDTKREKITLEISWKDYNGVTKTKTIEYKYKDESNKVDNSTLSDEQNTTNLNIY